MKYLILINGNPQSRMVWESFTDEQRAQGYELYAQLHERLRASASSSRPKRSPIRRSPCAFRLVTPA